MEAAEVGAPAQHQAPWPLWCSVMTHADCAVGLRTTKDVRPVAPGLLLAWTAGRRKVHNTKSAAALCAKFANTLFKPDRQWCTDGICRGAALPCSAAWFRA